MELVMSASAMVYDVIVVGAGVEGSGTAYQLTKAGYSTLLLEQFPVGHSRGSSAGHTRITRKAYTQDFYCRMMDEAYKAWAELEERQNTQLFVNCGMLTVGPNSSDMISSHSRAMMKAGLPFNLLSRNELKNKFPAVRIPFDMEAFFDPDAGILKADKCMQALQNEFCRLGGVIQDEEGVTGIQPGDIVTVTTSKGRTYKGKSIVLTCGPWTGKIVAPLGLDLPLQVERIHVFYWAQKVPGHEAKCFPTLFLEGFTSPTYRYAYAVPCLEYPNYVKLCVHNGPVINPDDRDRGALFDRSDELALAQCIRRLLPGLDDTPSIREVCMYTNTPDRNFILDNHPHWKNIVIGAGFSGHGFKLAPVVGKILAELATGRQPSYDLTPFKINRFHTAKL